MKRLMCKRLAGVAVTALALTLAGCGGSSNNKNESSTDSSGPSAELTSARSAYETADRRVGNLTDDSTDMEIRDAHNARVAAATALLAVETDSEEREKVAEAKGRSEALAKGARERISEAQDNEQDETRKTANAASMQVAEAILDHSTAMDDANTPDEFDTADNDGTPLVPSLRITRGSGDTTIKLNQNDDAAEEKEFKPKGGADAPTGAEWDDDWAGKTFTYTDSDGKEPMESAVVYTNIEMAGDREWTAEDLGTNGALTVTDATGVVAIDTSDTPLDVMRFSSNVLPAAPTDADDGANRKIDAGTGVTGTFYGVSGRFSCAADCTVNRDSDDMVTITGAMIFTPTVPDGTEATDLKAKYAMADADYLHFGHWMDSDKQKDGTYEHEIQTFSGGSEATSTFASIRGKATYSGAAAGFYVRKSEFDDSGDPGVVEDGTFVADASLTAQFGTEGTDDAGKVAVADLWTISGEISNFMDGAKDLGWKLMLKKTDLGGTGRSDVNALEGTAGPTFSGKTEGSAGARDGDWAGSMWGDPEADTDALSHPTGVAGEFNGHFTNGHVAGAFGASIDD